MAGLAAPRRSAKEPHPAGLTKLHRRRITLVKWFFLLVFITVGARLVQMQVDPDLRLSREDLHHVGQIDIKIPRGSIYDSRQRLLATDRPGSTLTANPQYIDDPAALAQRLSGIINLDANEILGKLTRLDEKGVRRKFVRVKRRLSEEEVQAVSSIVAEAGRGLAFEREPVRYYPEGPLAAHVIGFASRERVGLEGIELVYDPYLRSIPGRRRSKVDGKRVFVPTQPGEYVSPQGGDHIYLTINAAIQFRLEQELDKALVSAQAPRAMGMIMDPKSGAILALACRPVFDPNEYWKAGANEHKNRSVVDVFEPGSAFKIVIAAAALEAGLITPDTLIDCERGFFNPYGHRIKDYHPLGVEPFSQCFAQSSNIALIKVAALLGPERVENWIHRFGFGQHTSLDFQRESRGIVRPRSRWSRLSMGSLPMGQEIAVTMPQLARAFSVIANGGYRIDPYLVEMAESRDGMITYQYEHTLGERVLSAQTAKTMQELCHLVVLKGTGRKANIPEYRVGGKTGTAQMSSPNGGYMPGKFIAVFAGFAPLADPKLCAVIVVEEPGIKLHYGGQICAPVFKEVIREALVAMNCPEDPVREEAAAATEGSVIEAVGDELIETPPRADTVAPPVVAMEFLEPAWEEVREGLDGLELVSSDTKLSYGGAGLPDFTGMTKRQAQLRVASLGLNWDAQGSGRVIRQDPPPGTPIDNVALCRLVFSSQRPTPVKDHDAKPASVTRRM